MALMIRNSGTLGLAWQATWERKTAKGSLHQVWPYASRTEEPGVVNPGHQATWRQELWRRNSLALVQREPESGVHR